MIECFHHYWLWCAGILWLIITSYLFRLWCHSYIYFIEMVCFPTILHGLIGLMTWSLPISVSGHIYTCICTCGNLCEICNRDKTWYCHYHLMKLLLTDLTAYSLGVNLTIVEEMHSHLEALWELDPYRLSEQVISQTMNYFVFYWTEEKAELYYGVIEAKFDNS